jgi:predicted ATP-dependent endonuclease of OLD family
VIEKSGDRIDFDDTSLGRRWYFTYLFIKKVLKKGDVFIIDEPASFLHPEAQKTILRELEELARNGILIFLTTHSPYMISHDYSSIYFVSMTSRGTIIEKGEKQSYSLLKDTLGEVGFNNLLLNLSKKFIIVEGPGDLACFKTFIRLFGLDENKYEVWYLEGAYNIRRIKRFLENNRVNSVHVLDADMKKNYKYVPDDVVFVGEDTKEKSIEGLFHPKDRIRYFKKGKLAHDKIVSATIDTVEKETLENFQSLFLKMGILQENPKDIS